MRDIRTKKHWQRHLPSQQRRARANYYNNDDNKKKIVFRIFLLIVFIFLVQGIFQVPILRLEKINLENNQDLKQEEIWESIDAKVSENKYLVFKKNNYFLLPIQDLENILLEKYNLDSVSISKKFPDQLNIRVQEKISQFIWQKDDALYLLDNKGRLNRQIGAYDEKYLILDDLRSWRPNDDQVFNESEINKINDIYISWNEYVSDIKLVRLSLDDNWNLIELYTDVGFFVKLDSNKDIKEQIQNLSQVLAVENLNGTDIDYIDVRFGDKVYFK